MPLLYCKLPLFLKNKKTRQAQVRRSSAIKMLILVVFIYIAAILQFGNSFVRFSYHSHFSKTLNCHNHNLILRMTNTEKSTAVKLTLSQSFDISVFLSELHDKSTVAGVYVLEDKNGKSYYVGSSSNVVDSIKSYYQSNSAASSSLQSVRVQTFSVYNEEAVTAYRNELIRITSPPGNLISSNNINDASVPSNTAVDKKSGLAGKLQSLKKAVSNNIANSQSSGTSSSNRVVEFDTIVSPFEATSSVQKSTAVQSTSSQSEGQPVKLATCENTLDLTIENVNKVLDEVRPYLVQDGGNVAVVGIDRVTRGVKLLLQGACGSCPSSTTTMKMGIERVLKENFVNLGPVESVPLEELSAELLQAIADGAMKPSLTMEKVADAMDQIMKAIKGLGGKVEVLSVNEAQLGEVRLKFEGPPRLKKGLELVLKDVTGVTSVVMESFVV